MKNYFIPLFAFFIFYACQNVAKENAKPTVVTMSKEDSAKQVIEMAKDNTVAAFWAGTTDEIKNANHKEWNKYAASLDTSFARLTRKKFNVIEAWGKEELKNYQHDSLTVFYPFSGPDFFYANLLFPKAKKYIMVGLEPVGFAPSPAAMKDSTLNAYLNEVETSLYAIFNYGFFRTNAMRENFNKQNMNGMLPLLYLFVKRRGYDIVEVNKVRLDDNGMPEKFDVNAADTSRTLKKKVKGVHFILRKKGETATQELYYFSFDLSNSSYKNHPEFEKFVLAQHPFCNYLKAASCLMHNASFSNIRNLILNNAKMVLQDDSGMPAHYFQNEKWNLQLYGNYTGVIDLFKADVQPDLIQLYKTDSAKVKPLPFGTGYKFKKGSSNLQLAERK